MNAPSFSQRAVLGDQLLFVAADGIHGAELWVSNGTAAGTQLLRDINQALDQVSAHTPYNVTSL